MERGSRKERREIQAQHGPAQGNVREMKSEKLAYNYHDIIDQNLYRVQTHFHKYRTAHFRYALFYRVLFTRSSHYFSSLTMGSCDFCDKGGTSERPGEFYTCPKCNAPYCSLKCYRSPDHIQCTEAFYKQCVQEEMKAISAAQNSNDKAGNNNSLDFTDSMGLSYPWHSF